MCSLSEMQDKMRELHITAMKVGKAATWKLQEQRPHDPVMSGPIVVADVMKAALKHASDTFEDFVEKCVDGGASAEYVLKWGDKIASFQRWAETIKAQTQPLSLIHI